MSADFSAQKPVMPRLITRCQETLCHLCSRLAGSVQLRIALTLTLLVSSVVVVSVLVGVVPDRKAERVASRIQVAEAVATLGSILLREGDPAGFRNSLQFIVERNPDIHAVVLRRDDGDDVSFSAARSDTVREYSSGTLKTDVIHVPLLRQKYQWGELQVHFVSASNQPWKDRLIQARWSAVLFIPLASFALFLLLPGRFLLVSMHSQPGTQNEVLKVRGLRTEVVAKCKSGFSGLWSWASQKARDVRGERDVRFDQGCTGVSHDAVRRARILVVDDSEENRQFLSFVLGDMGYEVVLAAHGRQAIRSVFDAQRSGKSFDLVFMNVQMPIMDGFTAVKAMRLRGMKGDIVALASSAVPNARDKALAAGFSHFLAKPIDLDKMVALVRRLLATVPGTLPSRKSDTRFRTGQTGSGSGAPRLWTFADKTNLSAVRPDAQGVAPEAPEPAMKGSPPVFSKLPVAQPFFYRISDSFVDSLPVDTGRLRAAAIDHRKDEAAKIAASIKGSAVKAGYPGFAEFCKAFKARGGAAEHDIARSLTELERYAGRVIAGWHQTPVPRVAVQNSQFTATMRDRSTA